MSTSFSEAFKFYKRKCPFPELTGVVDPRDGKFREWLKTRSVQTQPQNSSDFGFLPPETWTVHEFRNHPGLLIIQNPFTSLGQRYWISRCLRDFPKAPHRTNLQTQKLPEEVHGDFWAFFCKAEEKAIQNKLKSCLRWSTLGYHHDWDRKVYSEKEKNPFPEDLQGLTSFLGMILGFSDFRAQAAIVNFYPQGSTLAGHTDHSEVNLEAPLFSISFGQEAIFLIGGPSKDDPATPLRLHSGDVVVMSRESRLCYHAVPKILQGCEASWNAEMAHLEVLKNPLIDQDLWEKCTKGDFWQPFDQYLSDCRINLNIRQVLAGNATTL